MTLEAEGHAGHGLTAGEAFVLPPHLIVAIRDPSDDLEILEVTLPAEFATEIVQCPAPWTRGGDLT